jgi:2-polyprenyl-6-methoxyphenol hydroxylase-like FAD-dependent oxidoreductase
MAETTTDILICGAGAAGLTLAVELARRNVAFRLIDKAPQPFPGSRGKGIQPRTQEVFEDLGIANRAIAAGGPYPIQREYRDGGFKDEAGVEVLPVTPAEPYAMPLMLPQFLTEAILRDRLAELGHRPLFGRELTGFDQNAASVTAKVRGEAGVETIRARYLIGADGGRSFVRRALGIDFPGKTLGVRAVVADLVLEGLGGDAWHRWNDGTLGQVSLCPLRGTELFQLQAPIALEGDVDLSAKALGALIAARTGRHDIAIHAVAWASAYTMNARLADRYRVGRVFLAGDAAHVHPPTGGQGLNTSIQDAYTLGWKLAAALKDAPPVLLASYEAERRPVAAEVLGLSTKLLDAAKERGDMRRGRETRQLDLGYPDSPLSLDRPFDLRRHGHSIRAGDRAPDAPCVGAGGQPTRLFELFRGTHWTLLGCGVPARPIAARADLHVHTVGERGDIVDRDGHIRTAYGVTSGFVLVRPDGYVSAVLDAGEVPALEQHLEKLGLGVPGQPSDQRQRSPDAPA